MIELGMDVRIPIYLGNMLLHGLSANKDVSVDTFTEVIIFNPRFESAPGMPPAPELIVGGWVYAWYECSTCRCHLGSSPRTFATTKLRFVKPPAKHNFFDEYGSHEKKMMVLIAEMNEHAQQHVDMAVATLGIFRSQGFQLVRWPK